MYYLIELLLGHSWNTIRYKLKSNLFSYELMNNKYIGKNIIILNNTTIDKNIIAYIVMSVSDLDIKIYV